MKKRIAFFLVSLSALAWVSCGGGGGGGGGGTPTPPAVSISVSPATSTVPAGATQQFTATVTNSTNTSVTWQVNSITGGNATVGTISTGGLYTAPLVIPATGAVTVAAISAADATKSDTSAVNILHSNAMLNGHYAFSYSGWNWDMGPFFVAGSFTADGGGNVSSGQVDYNGWATGYWTNSLTGTYSVNADGHVQFLLNDMTMGDYTLRGAVISPDRLRIIQFDTSSMGQGTVDRQDPAAFNNAAFAGNRAFQLLGGDSVDLAGAAGMMTADAEGNVTAGVLDINEGGIAIPGMTFTGQLTTAIGAGGRGELTLYTGSSELGDMRLAVYVVSANKAHLISLDAYPWMLGSAEKQTLATFSNASLSGGYAFSEAGFSPVDMWYYQAGRFTANGSGGVTLGAADENDNTYPTTEIAFTGTYSVDANGRGTATFDTGTYTSTYSFYMISPSRAFFAQQGYAMTTGEIDAQGSTSFTNSSLAGDYGVSMAGYWGDSVVQFTASGGNASGTIAVNVWGETAFVPTPDQAFSATYTVEANGHGALTATGMTNPFHLFMVSGSKAIAIYTGTDDSLLGMAEKQF